VSVTASTHTPLNQVSADLTDAAVAHLPSRKYAANAAEVSHTVPAFTLA